MTIQMLPLSMNKIKKIVLIISILVLSIIGYQYYVFNKLDNIGTELLNIKEIEDFSSNQNFPVSTVENIGKDLYSIFRSNKSDDISISVKWGDTSKKFNLSTKLKLRYTIIFSNECCNLHVRMQLIPLRNIFKIIGYTGSLVG